MTDGDREPTLREIFAPHGEEALKEHIAANIRAANAMAGTFGGEDPARSSTDSRPAKPAKT